MIERHFTVNKNSKSPDVKFSINPDELRILKSFLLVKRSLIRKRRK